jgi:hypothetical protein
VVAKNWQVREIQEGADTEKITSRSFLLVQLIGQMQLPLLFRRVAKGQQMLIVTVLRNTSKMV